MEFQAGRRRIVIDDHRQLFIDGSLRYTHVSAIFSNLESDSAHHVDCQSDEPEVGMKMYVYIDGEECPVFISEKISMVY